MTPMGANRFTGNQQPTPNGLFAYAETTKGGENSSSGRPSDSNLTASNNASNLTTGIHPNNSITNTTKSSRAPQKKSKKTSRRSSRNLNRSLNQSSFISNTDFGCGNTPLAQIGELEDISDNEDDEAGNNDSMMSEDLLQGLGRGNRRF